MNLVYLTALLFVFFFVVQKNVIFHAKIKCDNHAKMFEFISTVSNFQILNPTIINITHWEQTNDTSFFVEYTEFLSQIPVISNYGRAHYHIDQDYDGSYHLISQHLTCFYTDFLCLPTDSKLRISQISKSEVEYREEILYKCPWILTSFCFNEITYQRKQIISKLTDIFKNTVFNSKVSKLFKTVQKT